MGKPQTVGGSIIKGLNEAIAWTDGKNDRVRMTIVDAPEVNVRQVRLKIAKHAEAVDDVLRKAGQII